MRNLLSTCHGAREALCLETAPGKAAEYARAWAATLHDGFALHIPGGMSVRRLLTAFVGLDPGYVEDRVRAVFLDGRPVDDIDAAPVRPGQELSLSAAMPGVAGIVMGRANPLAVYRRDITFHAQTAADQGSGLILVKLFNFIAAETAPQFLALGAGLARRTWERFTNNAPANLWAPVVRAELDGAALDVGMLPALPPPAADAVRFLRIIDGEGEKGRASGGSRG